VKRARHQWVTTVVLATQEAEIRRTAIELRQGKHFTISYLEKTQHKKGWWSSSRWRTCIQASTPPPIKIKNKKKFKKNIKLK
jgi:hypothetical protein